QLPPGAEIVDHAAHLHRRFARHARFNLATFLQPLADWLQDDLNSSAALKEREQCEEVVQALASALDDMQELHEKLAQIIACARVPDTDLAACHHVPPSFPVALLRLPELCQPGL